MGTHGPALTKDQSTKGREQLTRIKATFSQAFTALHQAQYQHHWSGWAVSTCCSSTRHNLSGQELRDGPCPIPGAGAKGSITLRQTQKDTSFYLQHSSSDRQQKKKREQYSSTTQQRKGNGRPSSPQPPPEATGVEQALAAPSLPAQSTGRQGAAPHRWLRAQRHGGHGWSAQTGQDGTAALPRSAMMTQKPSEPCQERGSPDCPPPGQVILTVASPCSGISASCGGQVSSEDTQLENGVSIKEHSTAQARMPMSFFPQSQHQLTPPPPTPLLPPLLKLPEH